MIKNNDVVLFSDMTVARVTKINWPLGFFVVEYLLGSKKGETSEVDFSVKPTKLTHESYLEIKNKLNQQLATLEEAMAILHFDTRTE